MELETEKFIKKHKDNWLDLLQQEPYTLKANEDDNYVLLKYDMINSDFTEEIVKECRGLIIDKHTLKAKALSFRKFFNVQEPLHDDIDWSSAYVQEKVDGSKMMVWFNEYTNDWQISTSGTLDSYKANVNDIGLTFGKLFEEGLKTIGKTKEDLYKVLDKRYCYTFELVSPKSRIVVPYKETKLYFIGLRNIETFKEESPDTKEEIIKLGIERPKQYPLKTLDDCIKATEKMGYDEEGFVVVDRNWDRVKIKSPAYVSIHKSKGNVVMMSNILEMFLANTLDDFISIFPEYKEYETTLKTNYYELEKTIKNALETLRNKKFENRKELALYITKNNPVISSALFYLYDNKDITFEEWFRKQSKNVQFTMLKLKEKETKE